MKKFPTTFPLFLVVAAVLLAMSGIASAAGEPMASGDMNKLNAEISMINQDAKMPDAERVIPQKLADNFEVSSDRVNALLSHDLQYGDAAAILAFAEHLPGGITNYNVNEVMQVKSSKGSWDQVASNFGLETSSIADRLSGVRNEIKTALAGSSSGGSAAGGVNQPGEVGESNQGISGESTGGTGTSEEMGGQPSEGMSGGATGGTGTSEDMGGQPSEGMSGGAPGGTGTTEDMGSQPSEEGAGGTHY